MSVFVDTSALLAVINTDDPNHIAARVTWAALTQDYQRLITTNYVFLETFALVQRRHGLQVVQKLHQAVTSALHIHWVDTALHNAGVVALFTANRRQLSLVDCTSFHVMRQLSIDTVFAFDQHFAEQHFTCIP